VERAIESHDEACKMEHEVARSSGDVMITALGGETLGERQLARKTINRTLRKEEQAFKRASGEILGQF